MITIVQFISWNTKIKLSATRMSHVYTAVGQDSFKSCLEVKKCKQFERCDM